MRLRAVSANWLRASAAIGLLSAPVQECSEDFCQTFRVEQPLFEVLCNKVAEHVHRDRSTAAAGLALPGGGRACVIPVLLSFSGRT